MIKFTYNNKPYSATDESGLNKKLKKLGVSINDITIIPNTLIDMTPEWKLKGKSKHRWVNKNPNSKEYNYSIIGVHDLNITPTKPTHLMENPDDWVFENNIK